MLNFQLSKEGNSIKMSSMNLESKNINEEEAIELERLEKKLLGKKHCFLKTIEDNAETFGKGKVESGTTIKTKKPAWVDDDDYTIKIPTKLKKYATVNSEDNYRDLLRRQFQRKSGVPKWAKSPEEMSVEDDGDIDELMRCGNMLDKTHGLTKTILEIEKMSDLNRETKIEGPLICAAEFHPSSTAALIAGQSGAVSIVQVDGTTNSKLQTIRFQRFSVDCAHFTTDGEQFIIGNKKSRYFWFYDMMEGKSLQVPIHHAIGPMNMSKFVMSPDGKLIVVCGKYGIIHLLTAKTKEWIGDLKMNDDVVDVTFTPDGARMYSYSSEGEVYEWDMKNRRCVEKLFDDGCIKGSSIALSSSNQILATGSGSGIVNLYEMPVKNSALIPVKIVKNLVTSVSCMMFNHSSEILAICSKEKHNAVRLIHFPTMTVFSNFPGFQETGIPRVFSFSPMSGYFALGNSQGNVLLYRLKHYKNY